MRKLFTFVVGLGLVVAACNGSSTHAGVASLEEPEPTVGAVDEVEDEGAAVLEFAGCMRDNGIDGFEDPFVGAGGKIEFPSKATIEDDQAFEDGFAICGSLLSTTAFAGSKGGGEEAVYLDSLYELAVCLRAQGIDVSSPDPETGDIGDMDKDDPDFLAAYEVCGSALGAGKSK